ncbi:hypothetical protein FQN60_004931 [Etheostoma spectabile]|uniref:Uncharacterized protein n=1 Tax=Etheostoma spectabile TaxID=54343 RepID=A0A5J5DKZ2_9PERO|nr:hypothetical protein FQN60_004931 [Etheostoma spectabile]
MATTPPSIPITPPGGPCGCGFAADKRRNNSQEDNSLHRKYIRTQSTVKGPTFFCLLRSSDMQPARGLTGFRGQGAMLFSSNTGEFSSGQIESLATNPRQLHTADASLSRPPVPKTTSCLLWEFGVPDVILVSTVEACTRINTDGLSRHHLSEPMCPN